MTARARLFHGLTPRRLAGPALLGLILCTFNWAVATRYARGAPASELAAVMLQSYIGTVINFHGGLLAGIAAYNSVRGNIAVRVLATLVAVGLAIGVLLPVVPFVFPTLWIDVEVNALTVFLNWLGKVGLSSLAVAAIVYMTAGDEAALSLEAETRRELDLARTYDEARHSAMQAQIEPHFLFNTLANVRRLYEVDREAAGAMLRQFVRMLAQTLPDIRTHRSTLAREVALSLAYLNVQKTRMGERLTVVTDIPPALHHAAVPPMMLSTLVENAIKHGLAPLPQGGRVVVSARADGDTLHVEVADTGRGLGESAGDGVGLANIETRLAALFGTSGQLGIEPNEEGGVTACLQVPLRIEPPEHSDAA